MIFVHVPPELINDRADLYSMFKIIDQRPGKSMQRITDLFIDASQESQALAMFPLQTDR